MFNYTPRGMRFVTHPGAAFHRLSRVAVAIDRRVLLTR